MPDPENDAPGTSREADLCPIHGAERKRQTCAKCNAAYMRPYQRRRRAARPDVAMLERARDRARQGNIRYTLRREDIVIPSICPALGVPLTPPGSRAGGSPSLDRIVPGLGYVAGNVRVLSDRANRLKGNRTIEEVRKLACKGPVRLRQDYAKIAAYMEREALLVEVRARAAVGVRQGREWQKIAEFLERRFSLGASTTDKDKKCGFKNT